MNKHRTHQIDDLAQRVLRDALPPTWVPNEQTNDYGKDYLVEIGEDNGDLTGSSFYVQLKGQEQADISADGQRVRYSLETKYAAYYLDRIKDLPVFLVVADVNRKKGWWLFLQPVLEADQTWRSQDSITVSIPVANDLAQTAPLREAVEQAKRWMRLHHPESIQDAVAAHKERITRLDPRFDVKVSLVNDAPMYTLLAKEEVPITFEFTGDHKEMEAKVRELLDKGSLVAFGPGEVKVVGTKLLERIEEAGGAMQCSLNVPATLTLVAKDGEGREVGRLTDMPGRLVGGMKELWYEGSFSNSPLTVKLGPIAPDVGGSVQWNIALDRWNGQRLLQLAHFERLNNYVQALPKAKTTLVECQQDGNSVFVVELPQPPVPFAAPLARYLETLAKARRVAERFKINPVWTFKNFDQDALETAEQLFGIFFGSGWTEPRPRIKLSVQCDRRTFRFDRFKESNGPVFTRFTSNCVYEFMGERIEVGRLVHDYTEITMRMKDASQKKTRNTRKSRKGRARGRQDRQHVEIVMIGTENTVMSVRLATPEDDSPAPKGSRRGDV